MRNELQLELLWSLNLIRRLPVANRVLKALADVWDRFIQLPDNHSSKAAAAAVRAAQAELDAAANKIDPKFPRQD